MTKNMDITKTKIYQLVREVVIKQLNEQKLPQTNFPKDRPGSSGPVMKYSSEKGVKPVQTGYVTSPHAVATGQVLLDFIYGGLDTSVIGGAGVLGPKTKQMVINFRKNNQLPSKGPMMDTAFFMKLKQLATAEASRKQSTPQVQQAIQTADEITQEAHKSNIGGGGKREPSTVDSPMSDSWGPSDPDTNAPAPGARSGGVESASAGKGGALNSVDEKPGASRQLGKYNGGSSKEINTQPPVPVKPQTRLNVQKR